MEDIINEIGTTAFIIAGYRSLEKEKRNPLFIDDYAHYFVNEEIMKKVGELNSFIPEGTDIVRYRTRYFINKLKQFIANGVKQVVFLGGGFDMKACLHANNKTVKFFDVDQKPVLAFKKAIVEKHSIPYPCNFVPCNYIKDDLINNLKSHGFDCKKSTLFIWEGNTMYIPYEAIYNFLNYLKEQLSDFSISLDFLDDRVISLSTGIESITKATNFFANMGAPWITGFRELNELASKVSLNIKESFLMSDFNKVYDSEEGSNLEIFDFYSVGVIEK